MGNRTMLERMIENVLHNAIKFSHDGGVVQTEFRNKEIRISDTGVGMSPEHLAHVFERFYTVDIARSEHNKNGIGLGLSIVRQIANLHKITLKIDSKKDRGTVFSFTFLQ
jgi:two-component system phosphate regulon sensor histidine kinase PhoR